MNIMDGKQDAIARLCALHNVRSLAMFGSAARNELKADSDIDLMVDIASADPFEYTDHYFNLLEQLQHLFKRPIDLLESRAVRNPYLQQEIDRTKVIIYGQ